MGGGRAARKSGSCSGLAPIYRAMAEKRPRPAAREGGFQGDGADEQPWAKSRAVGAGAGALLGVVRSRCPFLDTIDRSVLDFDLYKQCSVTLTRDNVYICLVCGSYFHGRGRNTPAFTHSLQASHHVFLNLKNEKFYCLPGSTPRRAARGPLGRGGATCNPRHLLVPPPHRRTPRRQLRGPRHRAGRHSPRHEPAVHA